MADISTCTARGCGTTAEGDVTTCPQCGKRMLTARRVRTLGWILVVLGLFLAGFMGYIAWSLYPAMTHPGEASPYDGSRFTGTADQAAMILDLFWLVIGCGVLSIVNGLWQIVTGRRNLLFMMASLLLFAVILVAAWQTRTALGG